MKNGHRWKALNMVACHLPSIQIVSTAEFLPSRESRAEVSRAQRARGFCSSHGSGQRFLNSGRKIKKAGWLASAQFLCKSRLRGCSLRVQLVTQSWMLSCPRLEDGWETVGMRFEFPWPEKYIRYAKNHRRSGVNLGKHPLVHLGGSNGFIHPGLFWMWMWAFRMLIRPSTQFSCIFYAHYSPVLGFPFS